MFKFSVFRLLFEVVKFYSSCIQFIIQYIYIVVQILLVYEVRLALGYEFFNQIYKDLFVKMSMLNFKKKLCVEE